MKKNDIILTIVLLTIALLSSFGIHTFAMKDGKTAIVMVDGQIYRTLNLNENVELEIEGVDGGKNILVIEDGNAYMKDADCPDKVCVHQGKISRSNETIVCLPHKVVVVIQAETDEVDAIVQ